MVTPDQLPAAFFLDVAVGTRLAEDICAAYGLSPEEIEAIEDEPLYRQKLAQAEKAVADTGQAFRARCRDIAGNTIQHIQRIITDPEAPYSVQLDAFKTLVRYGDLETPKTNLGSSHSLSAPTLTLNIIAPTSTVPAFTTTLTPTLEILESTPNRPNPTFDTEPDEDLLPTSTESWGVE